jgi:indole-3-pyruvate monooxygenase
METTGTVIVGAGPAGLAVAACLRRSNSPFIVLEQGEAAAPKWRTRYDRLHLHTAKQYSGLPYLAFPTAHPRYPSRDQVVEYLELYRRHFDIEPLFRQRVTSLARDDGTWLVGTDAGAAYRAGNVAICTGRSDVPVSPAWPGQDTFLGEIIHSADYTSGERFAKAVILVVGMGNSGAEIALDLAEHGATADISLRSAVNVVPRDFLGQPIQRSTILLSRMPVSVRDRIGRAISRIVFGDLGSLGLPPAREGPVSQIVSRGRIPVIDVGTVSRVRSGEIGLRPGIERFAREDVQFVDGTARRYDAIILATGYRPGIAPLLAQLGVALERSGCPRGISDRTTPGLYFVGFRTPPTGHLRQIAIDAKQVAGAIAAA